MPTVARPPPNEAHKRQHRNPPQNLLHALANRSNRHKPRVLRGSLRGNRAVPRLTAYGAAWGDDPPHLQGVLHKHDGKGPGAHLEHHREQIARFIRAK